MNNARFRKFRCDWSDIEDLAFWWVFRGKPAKPGSEYVWPTDGGSYAGAEKNEEEWR